MKKSLMTLAAVVISSMAMAQSGQECYDKAKECYNNKNFEEAVKWARKGVEQGDAGSQTALGVFYLSGHGVSQDFKEAMKWFRKAAEQGDADALCMLAIYYYTGQGVEKNLTEGIELMRKAAEQGNLQAQRLQQGIWVIRPIL